MSKLKRLCDSCEMPTPIEDFPVVLSTIITAKGKTLKVAQNGDVCLDCMGVLPHIETKTTAINVESASILT